MLVIGIDPGLTRLGYGAVSLVGGRLRQEASGTLATKPVGSDADRLAILFEKLTALLREHRPDSVAVERVFFNLNEKTAVPVMRASGVALLVAAQWGAPVAEYTPQQVKQAVVGTGSASKKQVRFMVERLLKLEAPLEDADAADALALAICHMNSHKLQALLEAK